MRYLGDVAKNSSWYHIQDICINEMIWRVLKLLLNSQISSSMLELQKQKSNADVPAFNKPPLPKSASKGILKVSNSNTDIRQGKAIEKNVEFNNKLDINISQDKPNIDSLEADIENLPNNADLDKWNEWYQDFFNLVFGNEKESKEFYFESVFPIVEYCFNYPVDRLIKYEIKYSALYYSLIYHWGLKVLNEDKILQRLGMTEKPFSNNDIIKPFTKSWVYQMRNLPIWNYANKYKEYRSQGQTETALQACKNKIHYTQLLEDRFDLDAQGEISEILIEEGLYDEAIDQAKIGLMYWEHENSSAIKFYWVLMRAYQGKKQAKEAQTYFDLAISWLVQHWGQLHPLHSTIYGIMAFLMIESNSLKEAEYWYKASLTCCSKVLGSNHVQTAEVYMDFGRLYLKMHLKPEALANFRTAYYIYLSYFGKLSIPWANAAFYVATIMEEQRKLDEALEYALIASDSYIKLNGLISDLSITSQWMVVSISYSLKDPNIKEYWIQLYDMLVKRDKNYEAKIKESIAIEEDEDVRDRIDQIKVYLMSTVILDSNRKFNDERRYDARKYCESLFGDELQSSLYQSSPYQTGESKPPKYSIKQKIDPLNTHDVSILKFTPEAVKNLLEMYEFSKESKFKNIFEFYIDKVTSITQLKLFSEDNEGFGRKQNLF